MRSELFLIPAAAYLCLIVMLAAPLQYPRGASFMIEEGTPVSTVAQSLYDLNAIHSTHLFKALVLLHGGAVASGLYALPENGVTTHIAARMARGETGLPLVRITIPEGSTVRDIAHIMSSKFTKFDSAAFIRAALPLEGYLYPETYLFADGTPVPVILRSMQSEFALRTAGLAVTRETIIMASIIQKEARKHETMKLVSGILWRRIEIGMPLQVDAVFGYINATTTYSPTFAELKVDSPYNTYTNKGLPPGPIGSPGLDAITAALESTTSPYLYYLTGADGRMYYARTFSEHVANRVHLR